MKYIRFFSVLFMIIFLSYTVAKAQIDVKGKIKSKVLQRTDNHVDRGIDKGLDAVEEGVKDAATSEEETEAKADVQKEEETDNDTESDNTKKSSKSQSENTEQSAPAKESLSVYSKYDFVAGEKVIFYEDFADDEIGDFPGGWNTNGSAEIVTTNLYPGRWMKFSCSEAIWTDELLSLPENYTIEFDIIPIAADGEERMKGYEFRMIKCVNLNSIDHGSVPGKAGFNFGCQYYGEAFYRAYNNESGDRHIDINGSKEGDQYHQKKDQKYHMAIWVQKSRVRLYQEQNKLFDLPKALIDPQNKIDRIRFENGAAMVSNIRIAVGNPDMRSKLLTEGKLVSYGIYFDVNKDVVKPESYGTLKGIAQVLTENPDVKIKIEGHTDADGDDAKNLDLSKRRAASVKNEMVKTFGIDESRITTDGSGETKPVAANDTPSNKALNRRVEFIKL